MNGFDIDRLLEQMCIVVDTREQLTDKAVERYTAFGVPYIRHKLDFGDYSAFFGGAKDTDRISLVNKVSIERKYDLTELCSCFTTDRKRFSAEFERLRQSGEKMYLLVENGTWEKAYKGDYRSQMHPNALIASMTTWLARFNCQLVMCRPETSGKLIAQILYREGKEYMMRLIEPTRQEAMPSLLFAG